MGEYNSFPWIAQLYIWYVCTLYCWVLSKEVSSIIFKVFTYIYIYIYIYVCVCVCVWKNLDGRKIYARIIK